MTRTATVRAVFDRPLRSASIASPDDPAIIEKAERRQAIASLSAMQTQIQSADTMVQQWMQELHAQSVSLAIEIAKTVLQSDDELIQQRVEHFAQLSTESIPRTKISSIVVHPSCERFIQEWASQTDFEDLSIRCDSRIPVGDCLVESGDTGVMAALESCFETVLNQLVRREEMPPAKGTSGGLQ